MKLTELSIKRPVTTMMILLSFVVVGYISFSRLPMEFFPALDVPFVGVYIPYPNSTPEEVEKEITRPVEEVLAMISGVNKIKSNSSQNSAWVELHFNWGEDSDIKALETREKLDGIKHLLPDDMERFFVFKFNTSDMPVLQIRVSSNRDISNSYELLQRNLKRPLERLNGVAEVDMYGVEKKEIKIEVNPDRLIAHSITTNDLINVLMRSDFSISNGELNTGSSSIMVRSMSKIKGVDDLKNLKINNSGLLLSNIAEVSYTAPKRDYGRHLNGKYAVGLSIKKSSEANTINVTNRILDEIEKIKKSPEMEGINVYLMENQGEGIKSSLKELLNSGLLGGFFALLILYFFLRSFSNTLIVILSVPFSMLITGVVMYFMDISLNVLSMMGLMLAVGMLVDNGVVTMESIHKHQRELKDRKKSAVLGTGKIALAITAGTITSVIVFLPNIINDSSVISIYLKYVGVPLVIALLASLAISLTAIPVLTTVFNGNLEEKKNQIIENFKKRYLKILTWLLDHHKGSIFIILATLFSIGIPVSFVKSGEGSAMGRKMRLFYNINGEYKIERVVEEVETYYNTGEAKSVLLLKKEGSGKTTEELMELIKKDLPKISIGNPAFEWKTARDDDVLRVRLTGKSSKKLIDLSEDIVKYLSNIEGLTDLHSEASSGDKEIMVVVDRIKAGNYGFSTAEIARTISSSMRGTTINKLKTDDGEIDISLKFREEDRRDLEDLKEIPLKNRDGKIFKLKNLANFKYTRGPGVIRRDNRETSIGIQIGVDGITKEESRPIIESAMERIKLPLGYKWDFGWSFQNWDMGIETLKFNLLLALVLIYFVMAALFESFILPISIWSSIIFAVIGVYWSFLLTGTTFSFMAWIGVLILVGVVVNNGIVLIEYINNLIEEGYSRKDAVLKAGSERFRPILMTAGTTILSMLPLCMVTTQIGGNGPPYYPMARAIVGGLFFSTTVTLLILPSIYIILDDIRNKYLKIITKALR